MSNLLISTHVKIIQNIDNKQIIVCGDLHGDYESFNKVIKKFKTKNNILVFLGDYADRGKNGIEIITELLELMNKHKNIIPIQGNHEGFYSDGQPSFYPCDLINEANRKTGSWKQFFESVMRQFIKKLYIAAMIPGQILLVHGGIHEKIKSIKDLKNKKIARYVLWSDPDTKAFIGRPSFDINTTKEVCKNLDIKLVIRGHQPRLAKVKPYFCHDKRILTIHTCQLYGRPHVLIIKQNTNKKRNKQLKINVCYLDNFKKEKLITI